MLLSFVNIKSYLYLSCSNIVLGCWGNFLRFLFFSLLSSMQNNKEKSFETVLCSSPFSLFWIVWERSQGEEEWEKEVGIQMETSFVIFLLLCFWGLSPISVDSPPPLHTYLQRNNNRSYPQPQVICFNLVHLYVSIWAGGHGFQTSIDVLPLLEMKFICCLSCAWNCYCYWSVCYCVQEGVGYIGDTRW